MASSWCIAKMFDNNQQTYERANCHEKVVQKIFGEKCIFQGKGIYKIYKNPRITEWNYFLMADNYHDFFLYQ